MDNPEVNIRALTKEEVQEGMVQLYLDGGLSCAIHDFSIALALDPTCFYCLEINGEKVGTISVFRWDETYAFASSLIVLPKHRKKGYSVMLTKASAKLAGKRNLGADVGEALTAALAKDGVKVAYRHDCYLGFGKRVEHPLLPALCDISEVPFASLVAYDTEHFPVPRAEFLRLWIKQPGLVAKAYMKDGKLLGYGALKEGSPRRQLGPLYAETEEVAHAILAGLVNSLAPEEEYELFIHTPNINIPGLVEAFDLKFSRKFSRIYTRRTYALPDNSIYCPSSTDLG